MPETDTILAVQGLTRHFGGVRAVENVSTCIQRGSITSLIGPNGAGKTTLFNMVTSLIAPTSGSVVFRAAGGRETILTGLAPHRIAPLGIARTFQNIRLFDDQRVVDNVKVGLHTRTRSGLIGALLRLPATRREERRIECAALKYLDYVGLGGKAWDLAANLAYGERRRLEIARALAADPSLLLLDEPAAGMNPNETEALMDLIGLIRRSGITIFLIEHDMKLVMRISDHIVCLDHGERIADGAPGDIRNHPQVIQAYLGVDAE